MSYDPTHYTHHDTDDSAVSLHDCFASGGQYENRTLSFSLADGFWIGAEHPANHLHETVRTDAALVTFTFDKIAENDISIYVFQKTLFGRTIRKEWSLPQLIERINRGTSRLEFLYQNKGDYQRIIECCLHLKKHPYLYECQLCLPEKSACYYWNALREDTKW